jgi:MarR family 2-MHQ and catechol resistance regulon transcriptional repressor
MKTSSERTIQRQAEELHDALSEFARLYHFRDRDRICCHDVPVTQCYALEILTKRVESTLNELAGELCLEKSTASRVVTTLERKGYVVRSGHPRDGRAILLRATASGLRLYARIRTGLIEEKRRLLRDFSLEVADASAKMIRRLTTAVRERTAAAGAPGVLPKVLLTGRSLESLPPGSRSGSASRAPSGAPGCSSPRSSRGAARGRTQHPATPRRPRSPV